MEQGTGVRGARAARARAAQQPASWPCLRGAKSLRHRGTRVHTSDFPGQCLVSAKVATASVFIKTNFIEKFAL